MKATLTRRAFLRASIGAASAAALAACALPAGPQSGGQAAGQPAAATKELSFAWWTGGEGANRVFEAAIDRFEAHYPEYTVNRITSPGGDEFHTKLLTNYGAGTAPDAHGLQWGPVWAFAHKGVLANLTPFVERDAGDVKLEEMWEAITGMLYYPVGSNTMVALPRETFGLYMRFYNKQILADAGIETPDQDYAAGEWTWDVWRQKVNAATRFSGERREIMGGNQGVGLWDLATVFPSLGVPMLNEEQTHFNIDAEAVQDWLQMVADMVNIDRSLGKPEETREFDWGASGKLAIQHDASWSIPNKKETWANIDWDFVPPPKGEGGHSNVPGCDFHAVNGSPNADQEGGWTLIKFLNSPEEDLWWSVNMYGPPFRKQNLETWIQTVSADLPKDGWQYIGDMTAAATPWPNVPFFLELDTIHSNEIVQAISGERTVEDVVTSIAAKVDEMIAKFE
jgi:ABC-type glycerol-3-phosphate transport system substrate-binding protein